MENKDDLISRRAALEQFDKNLCPSETFDQIAALPGQMTAAEAWEIAKEIVCNQSEESLQWIFNTTDRELVLLANSPEEAKAAMENRMHKIKVGDVVEDIFRGGKAVVTAIEPDSGIHRILYQDGSSLGTFIEALRKTGKTIDIQSVLERIGV